MRPPRVSNSPRRQEWLSDVERHSAIAPDAPSWPCKLGLLPTVLRNGPYRCFFYSADRNEPPHVPVEREEASAKFWLDPVRLETSRGFGRAEIHRLERLVAASVADIPKGLNQVPTRIAVGTLWPAAGSAFLGPNRPNHGKPCIII